MPKFLLATACIIFSLQLRAQTVNHVKITAATGDITLDGYNKNSRKFTIEINDFDKLKTKKIIYSARIRGLKGTKVDSTGNLKSFVLDIASIFQGKKDTVKSFLLVLASADSAIDGKKIHFTIDENGKLTTTQRKGKENIAGETAGDEDGTAGDNPYWDVSLLPTAKVPCTDCKDYNLVVYEPCCNTYTITALGKKGKKFLWYKTYKPGTTNGVIFMVKDFNTTKYAITVSNTFETQEQTVPDIFGSVFKVIAPFGFDGSTSDIQLVLEQTDLLNKALKNYFLALPDCEVSKYGKIKGGIVTKINDGFNVSSPLDFEVVYQHIKAAFIIDKQTSDPKYDDEAFEKEMTATFGVKAADLVTDTKNLLITLLTARYEYQYNVPQIQNVDAIVFTLNIKPKDGSNGSIHVVDQPLRIPIHGGLKVDFTTGLYYSSIRNGSYILKATADSSHQQVIDENSSKHTIGVNGLMHISSRLGVVNPSLVIGVGGSTELNFSLLIGAGLSFGNESKFALSGGLNFSSIKQLSAQYTDNAGNRLLLPISTTTISTYNVIKRGAFISLTYSLGLTKKTQDASKALDDAVKSADTKKDSSDDASAADAKTTKDKEKKK